MKNFFLSFFLLLALAVPCFPAHAGTVIGFNRFENLSTSHEFDYLSKILPDSFAVSVESSFDISSVRTKEIEKLLSANGYDVKSIYDDAELSALAGKLQVDYFVYGSFHTLPYDKIEIRVNIFNTATGELFSFTNTGLMETEIFNLVDRLTAVFEDFFKHDFRFQSESVAETSKLAFITNLSGLELNDFYLCFLEKGYKVSPVQANDLVSAITTESFDKLKYVSLKDRKFTKVRTGKPIVFHRSSWNGKNFITAQSNFKNVLVEYFYKYPEKQERVLKNLSEKYRFNIDYLFIVGFDETRQRAWIRVFDLRKFDSSLIWMQAGIRPEASDAGVPGIAKSIISMFTNEGQK